MKTKNGFTLIELVVVIVILGILAVTAAPKFLNLQSDARTSALNGLKGAMAGASGIVYGKAAVAGIESQGASGAVASDFGVDLLFGYPSATNDGIASATEGLTGSGDSSGDWDEAMNDGEGYYVATFKQNPSLNGKDEDISNTNCYVKYQQATSVAEPVITVTSSGC